MLQKQQNNLKINYKTLVKGQKNKTTHKKTLQTIRLDKYVGEVLHKIIQNDLAGAVPIKV